MKKFFTALMAFCLALSLSGCVAGKVTDDIISEMPETTVAEETTSAITDTAPETSRVTPLPQTIDLNTLTEDCTLAVSFGYGDLDAEEKTLAVTVYDYELFDMADVSMLREGDTIVLSGKDMVIETIERNDMGLITINGGLEEGGTYLKTDENTVYYEIGMSDMKTYHELGEITIPLSPDMVYSLEADYGEEPVICSLEDFKNLSEEEYYFTPHNTKIHVKNGANGYITKIERRWVP